MKPRSLVELVLHGAARVDPSKPAVLTGDASLGYRDLVAGAGGIAAALAESGVGRGDRVGIWMDKTPRCVQTILGVMAAGAAYVPLDPRAPWRRCRAIAIDSDVAAIAVDAPRLKFLSSFLEGPSPRLMLIDADDEPPAAASIRGGALRWEMIRRAASRPAPDLPGPGPDDIAYILYTSGSTGTPKGVVHTHRSGLAFTTWVQEAFGVVAEDVFSSHAPFHFDLSISDLYASLGAGASIRLISSGEGMLAPYLIRVIDEWGITVWYSVPSILAAMVNVGDPEVRNLRGLRTVLFAGEVFPTPQLRRLRRALPRARLVNLFGPTETNVCTYYEVPADIPDDRTAPIPIGKACEHLETFVIDEEGHEAGVGMEGTLWVRGANLMQGYWNDPVRTAATLRPDPRRHEGIAYCTGDRVRLQPDGDYEFLGRSDEMVKVRGYRVELGEIESVLTAHPEVLEAVAVAFPDPAAGNRIVAAVVRRDSRSLDSVALHQFSMQYLPTYMVPERIEIRSAIPRTSTGKADRSALRAELERKETG